MADGAAPTISPKEAIALGRQYFDDLVGGYPLIARVLLEGLSIDEMSGNWIVSFGFDSERQKAKRYPFLNVAIAMAEEMKMGIEHEIVREFRAVHLSSSDGSFVKLDHA